MSFISVLDKIGHDFKVTLDKVLPWAAGAGSVAVSIFDPAIAPLFQATLGVVSQTEQKFAAMGQQTGTGAQKLSDVITIMGPLIQQGFIAAGQDSTPAAVEKFVNAAVAILNATPAPNPPKAA